MYINITSEDRSGATSSKYEAIYSIPANSSVAIFPTAAGTATLYYSTSPVEKCKADVAAGQVTSGNTAQWTAWTSGAVSALAREITYAPLTTVAVVPASGTWSLEVCK